MLCYRAQLFYLTLIPLFVLHVSASFVCYLSLSVSLSLFFSFLHSQLLNSQRQSATQIHSFTRLAVCFQPFGLGAEVQDTMIDSMLTSAV